MPETRYNTFTRKTEYYDVVNQIWTDKPPATNQGAGGAGYDYSNLIFNPGTPEDDFNRDPFKGYNRFLEFQVGNPSSQENEPDPFSRTLPSNNQTTYQGRIPTTTDELHAMIRSGEIKDKSLIEKLEVELSNAELAASKGQESTSNSNEYAMGPADEPMTSQRPNNFWMPALNFAGSDLSTEAYSLGMRLGQKQGTPGKTLGIIGSAGAFTLGAARDLLSGLSTQRANNWMNDWYEKNKNKTNYTADEQYTDANYLGGLPKRDGGYVESMQDGGTTDKSALGYRAPLDGSTMDKDQQAAFALLRNKYGDKNYFADQYNTLRDSMEESYLENPNFVDADGNIVERSYDPDSLQGPAVSMRESRRMARDLNKVIRKNNLPYQKIQHDAFYNPNGKTDMVARFQDGGATGQKSPDPKATATIEWLDKNPYTPEKGKPIDMRKMEQYKTNGYPRMQDNILVIPGAGSYGPDKYQQVQMPEGYQGYPIYIVNGKPVVVDPKFNKEYFNMYMMKNFARKAELIPVYGRGTPYIAPRDAEEEQEIQQAQPPMRHGGYVVGEYAEFEYGGEIVRGIVQKIENGKIYI